MGQELIKGRGGEKEGKGREREGEKRGSAKERWRNEDGERESGCWKRK